MPRFNKDRYIGDDSYEIPWKSLQGNVNHEGKVRNYLQTIEDHGYVQWDDHATVTDLDSSDWGISHGYGGTRSIVVEGTDPDGEEVVFVKAVKFPKYPFRPGPPTTSSSFVYAGGKRLSPYQITQRLKLGKKSYEKMVKEGRAEKKNWEEQYYIKALNPREDLDWS